MTTLTPLKINVSQFCDMHGVKDTDRFVFEKTFANHEPLTYDEWYDKVVDMCGPLNPRKNFNTTKKKQS